MAGTTQYKNNWQKDNLDRISLTVPKGQKKEIQSHALAHNESINAFVHRAIFETLNRDQKFEQNREKVMDITQKYGMAMDEREIRRLVEAFAILEPQVPSIMNIYFSRLQQEQPSNVIVINSDTN